MKYKAEDRVRVKSLEWYNENKDKNGNIYCNDDIVCFTSGMSNFCGCILTIKNIDKDLDAYNVEENIYCWIDDMFEENVEETSIQGKFGLWENKINGILFSNENYADKVELCLGNDYEIVVEDGRTFVQRKKPKYPTTYEECCKIMGIDSGNFVTIRNLYCIDGEEIITDYEDTLKDKIRVLWELLICRDAYWEIADNWKPDWNDDVDYVYTIKYNGTHIRLYNYTQEYAILAFPTEEMRDAFYENFKDLIEKCKELL